MSLIGTQGHSQSHVTDRMIDEQSEPNLEGSSFPAQVTLTGHRRAVTALRYSANGSQLASGSQDTDIILWDVIAETGLFRLRAHTAEVTDLVGPLNALTGKPPCCLPLSMRLPVLAVQAVPDNTLYWMWPEA